jgi:branched-subunit amino acid aminotransferase/4-amino-4-deoxychorismate lyase
MSQLAEPRIEVNGQAATPAQLRTLALGGFGHFTAMQVRGQAARGLGLHLVRLDAASRELFGTRTDGTEVRAHIRHALGADVDDASVRVIVQRPDDHEPPWITVTVRPPAAPLPDSALQSAPYQRSVAHIKHVADFGQGYYGRRAGRNGFDEAVLTGPDGLISEGSMTNIGFFDGTSVVWPAAPVLAGITMQLIQARLACPQRHSPVRLADLGSFSSVFITNSHGVAAVTRIDERELPVDRVFMRTLTDCYGSAPWDPI